MVDEGLRNRERKRGGLVYFLFSVESVKEKQPSRRRRWVYLQRWVLSAVVLRKNMTCRMLSGFDLFMKRNLIKRWTFKVCQEENFTL